MKKLLEVEGIEHLNTLSSRARLILHVLAVHEDTGEPRVSVPTIAQGSGMGRTTVYRYLKELDATGYIVRELRPSTFVSLAPDGRRFLENLAQET